MACTSIANGEYNSITIEVEAMEYQWHYTYGDLDRELHPAEDKNTIKDLILPPNCEVTLRLRSSDFLYLFELPDFAATEMAVPGLVNELTINTKAQGVFELKGNQMCGFTHESLLGNVKVLSASDFTDWLNK